MKRGVEVEIMIPGKSDIPFTPDAAFYTANKLRKKGAKIYVYNGGFHHSKIMMVDSLFCTVGSTNLNSRSLRYDYEVNAFILTKKPHMNWAPCSSMTSWTVPCLPRKNIKTLRMETLRRLVRQSVHSVPINLCHFPKQRFTDCFISCKDGAYPIRKYAPCSKAWQVIIKESNACKQEKGYSTITDGIPDKCGKPRLSCKETLFSPYVSLYYRTKIK